MVISSRTPEGQPNHCPVCGNPLTLEPSDPAGDAPCPRCGHLLWFTWEELGCDQIIRPIESLVLPESFDRLFESITLGRGTRIVIDFTNVWYISSAALGKLITLSKKLRAIRGKLRLRGMHPDLRDVFRVCRLDQVFEIEA